MNELTEIKEGEIQIPIRVETELDKDLNFAKGNLKDIAEIGGQAIAELAQVCSQSGDRVDYEKLAILMKAAADVNNNFAQISQTKDILNKPPEPTPETSQGDVTNIAFMGSTSEMADLIRQLKEKNV